jgi:apolipoprotein N-acyltransferase
MKQNNSYFLLGAPVSSPLGPQNGYILLDNKGNLLDSYAKQHLVPIAESLPLGDTPFVRRFVNTILGGYPFWTQGRRDTIFSITNKAGQTINFSTPICYDDAFAQLARRQSLLGSEIFIVPSNDSWSARPYAAMQHLVAARFRAIETRRPMARAANAGITTLINQRGELKGTLTPFTTNALAVTAQLPNKAPTTLYMHYGDWPIGISLLVMLLVIIHQLLWPTTTQKLLFLA